MPDAIRAPTARPPTLPSAAVPHPRQRLGKGGEDIVARRLERDGYRILARNIRVRYREWAIAGELDLIALDGTTLVFVEVKTGRIGARAGPERPVFAVGPAKQRRLRRLARAWLGSEPGVRFQRLRFDVVGVSVDREGRVVAWEHLRDAF
jgi:putative endonuclease